MRPSFLLGDGILALVSAAAALRIDSTSPPRRTDMVPFYLEQTEVTGRKKLTYVLAHQSDGTTVRIERDDHSSVRDVFLPDGTAVSVFDALNVRVLWPNTGRQGVEADPLPGCDINHAAQPSDNPAGVDVVLGQVVAVSETTMGNTVIT